MADIAKGPAEVEALTLLGRTRECGVLDRLMSEAQTRSQVLVLRGEPGIGKTALLDYAAAHASAYRITRTAGIESEMELPYAGLQQLCAPLVDYVDALPGPQRDALTTALGLTIGHGGPPEPFHVGLGTLSLFAAVADTQPLLCIVDDVQWLDHASAHTLAFVARRLQAEAVAMLFGARTGPAVPVLSRLRELVVGGLSDAHARCLLDAALLGPLDAAVVDTVVAEANGVPLALLELPRAFSATELAGGFGLPRVVSARGRLTEIFERRLSTLPKDTRRLLVIASADPLGDPGLLQRSAEQLAIQLDVLDAAVSEGLIELRPTVRFRHPVVRSIVYRSASNEDRRSAHRALAEATDLDVDPDRRAWHRACATSSPDDTVAEALEQSAERAALRGGAAASAAFLTRAVQLSVDPAMRGARALAAARATLDAGATDAVHELLAIADRSPLCDLERAKAERVRADLAFTLSRGSDAPSLLLKAAQRLENLDVTLARETHLEAISAAQFAGRLAVGADVKATAEAARHAPPPMGSPRAADLLLDGLAVRFTKGFRAGAPILKRALRAFRDPDLSVEESLRWLFRASTTALDLWDDDTWELLSSHHLEVARRTGVLAVLPLALTLRVAMQVFAGELASAAALIDQTKVVIDATGMQIAPYGELLYLAWKGQEAEAAQLIHATEPDVVARGEGVGLSVIEWASALIANAAGRYSDALVAGLQASEHPEELGISTWALLEVIESASRLGDIALATDALQRLAGSTTAAGTDWALGVEARSRAIVTGGDDAEKGYREAIDRLGHTRVRPELARSHLLYGEWLRRTNRRVESREHLRTAHELFRTMGCAGFADRARRELLATGETVRKRSVNALSDLTPQETQIARLAAEHHTNAEIAALLFLSPRTVEWHLRKVFTKLGISSRRELRTAMPS